MIFLYSMKVMES